MGLCGWRKLNSFVTVHDAPLLIAAADGQAAQRTGQQWNPRGHFQTNSICAIYKSLKKSYK